MYTNQKTTAYLQEIAILCEVSKNLTYHLARYTSTTLTTLANGVPIESVSKMLGHTGLRITQVDGSVQNKQYSRFIELAKCQYSGNNPSA